MGTSCGLPLGRTVASRAIIGRARNTCISSFVIDGGAGLAGAAVAFFSAAPTLEPLPRAPASNKASTTIFGVSGFLMNNAPLCVSRVDSLAARMPDLQDRGNSGLRQ